MASYNEIQAMVSSVHLTIAGCGSQQLHAGHANTEMHMQSLQSYAHAYAHATFQAVVKHGYSKPCHGQVTSNETQGLHLNLPQVMHGILLS